MMTVSENVSLQKYADSANQRFYESEKRLSQIEGSFQTRMNGKTIGGLVGAMLGTVCWLVVFCAFFWYIRAYVDNTIGLICFGISLALVASLIIDEIISFFYYGKISSYKNNITQLKNRVSVGRSSIKSNQDTFMKSRANGWYHPLSVGSSIPDEAASIESTINGMESLKGGFINGLKNFLFFTFAIAITAVGSWALFGIAGESMTGISGEYIDGDTINTLCIIGLVITVVGEIILAKMVWGETNCSVTNATLFIAAAGPVMFLVLVIVATFSVMLIMWAFSIALAIGALAIAGACIYATISGG